MRVAAEYASWATGGYPSEGVSAKSRLRQQQGKQKEAHAVLAEIYGWFTEGFDTKDLQEAKALLAARDRQRGAEVAILEQGEGNNETMDT